MIRHDKQDKYHSYPAYHALSCLSCYFLFPLCVLCALCGKSTVDARELSPWFPRVYEFQPKLTYQLYHFETVKKNYTAIPQPRTGNFYTGSVGLAGENWHAEIESTLANTQKQKPACDNVRFTGRYSLLSDTVDDPFSLTAGFTLTQAFRHSVHDITSFHHGKVAAELHVAIGRETSCERFWLTRVWSVAGFGVADSGSPWAFVDCHLERNWWDRNRLSLFFRSLWGLGRNNLHPCFHFHGYGSIRHQSIDLGVSYSYQLETTANITVEYRHRVYARNFPSQANLIALCFHFPFGL